MLVICPCFPLHILHGEAGRDTLIGRGHQFNIHQSDITLVTEMIEVFSEFFPKILRDNCLHNTLVGTPESGVKTIPEGFGCALNESRVGCALNEIRNRFDYIIINYFVRF